MVLLVADERLVDVRQSRLQLPIKSFREVAQQKEMSLKTAHGAAKKN
jgi:hypothetical protein